MTNFDLHDQAQQLADTRSAYSLARELLELKAKQDGWHLVPRIPTPQMCSAFHKADTDWRDGYAFDDNGGRHESPVYQWVAMVDAAPKPGEL